MRACLGDLLGEVAQGVELGTDGLGSGKLSVSVAVLGDELAPDFGGTEAGVEAIGAELGIGLALAINDALCERPRPISVGAATNVPLGLRLHTSLL